MATITQSHRFPAPGTSRRPYLSRFPPLTSISFPQSTRCRCRASSDESGGEKRPGWWEFSVQDSVKAAVPTEKKRNLKNTKMAATALSSTAVYFFTSSLPPSSTTQGSKSLTPFPNLPLKSCVLAVSAKPRSLRSSFVCNVAAPSDVDQDVEEAKSSPGCKLLVANLSFTVDTDELASLFGQAGTVESVELIYDKETGKSRGCAFVTMSTIEEAEAATEQLKNHELDGRALRVSPPAVHGRSVDFPLLLPTYW